MGTRGVVGFVLNGQWSVAYNHWDSYPEYLGEKVLAFCKETDLEALKVNVAKIQLLDEEDIPTAENIVKYTPYADLSVGNQDINDWYCLLRKFQGVDTLVGVRDGVLEHIFDNSAFMGDSLFCEWGYIVDLDKMTLKVYRGFNKKFYEDTPLPPNVENKEGKDNFGDGGYYPVFLIREYRLDKLPKSMAGVIRRDNAMRKDD